MYLLVFLKLVLGVVVCFIACYLFQNYHLMCREYEIKYRPFAPLGALGGDCDSRIKSGDLLLFSNYDASWGKQIIVGGISHVSMFHRCKVTGHLFVVEVKSAPFIGLHCREWSIVKRECQSKRGRMLIRPLRESLSDQQENDFQHFLDSYVTYSKRYPDFVEMNLTAEENGQEWILNAPEDNPETMLNRMRKFFSTYSTCVWSNLLKTDTRLSSGSSTPMMGYDLERH